MLRAGLQRTTTSSPSVSSAGDLRPCRAVEGARVESGEERLPALLLAAGPHPRLRAVLARVMGVICGDGEELPPRLERLVPVEAGVTAPDLELAARVEDLDAGEPLDLLELVGAQAAPVRVRDEGHAAVCAHPGDGLLEPGKIGGGRLGIRLDAEREHVRVRLPVPAQRVELSPRNRPAGAPSTARPCGSNGR